MATAQTELAPESGITLQKRVLSFPEVPAQSVANMAPSAAMALLPFLVFLSAGNATWLSFALSLVVHLLDVRLLPGLPHRRLADAALLRSRRPAAQGLHAHVQAHARSGSWPSR
jgi:hypothetical protein